MPDADQLHSLFTTLANARREELRGWPLVAAMLVLMDGTGWWRAYGESEEAALAMPEFQIPKTTAAQYRAVWRAFNSIPPAELEKVRPRLLNQAVEAVTFKYPDGTVGKILEGGERATPAGAVADAQVMSWSAYVLKYNPKKSHLKQS